MLSNNIVVPFIDKTFLDISHARKILKEENPLLLTEIMPVDIENIITKKGLNITNTHISKDKSIHGMIVCGKSDINFWDNDRKGYNVEFCNGNTIFVDSLLSQPNMINRYRFTLAHEFAHWLLHRGIIKKIAKEKKILPFLSCTERDINSDIIEKVEAHCEWQANYLAGALLMPYLPLKNYFQDNSDGKFLSEETTLKTIAFLASAYVVSVKAMYIRLRQLEYINSISLLE
jgi:Zn-dependent peptidase ImmA (M78 family)